MLSKNTKAFIRSPVSDNNFFNIITGVVGWLVGWVVLWHINFCKLFNAKSILYK